MKKIAFLFGLILFIAGVATLPNYGINWDTINHLPRGQAYLHYFLTGKRDYSDFPLLFHDWQKSGQWYWQNPSSLKIDADVPFKEVPTRSLYQNSETSFNYFMTYDGYGHPPLSDILSAFFNRVLFGKLRLINDVDSYRVYGVMLASILVGFIFWWVSKYYGKLAGFVASASLALYPLFWSELHFNTEKDIPETVYWSFFLFFVWQGIVTKKIKWILLSGILFGLALGTKFNILFSVIVIVPWFLVYLFTRKEKLISKVNIKLIVSGIVAFGIGSLIFLGSWPYLWSDPIAKVSRVIQFYSDIGVATGVVDTRFVGPMGINTYPLFWIAITTPVIILVFASIGIIVAVKNFRKDKNATYLLFLLWLLVPIIRVTWHGANIYGGVRQIMEYIPALAIFTGIGVSYIVNKLKIKRKLLSGVFVSVIFIFLLMPIIKTHPNENVYFNFLIGGLAGAKEKNIPAWGNSFGAAYRQAVVWIDENLPKGADLTFAYELIPNIPRIWIRTDINLTALNRSGYFRRGEYAVTINYQGTNTRSYYDMYLDTFLNPVYESKVDGVAVATVWKNDDEHLKQKWVEKKVPIVNAVKGEGVIRFDLSKQYKISRLDMSYVQTNCSKLTVGYFEISTDGVSWMRLPGVLPDDWAVAVLGEQPKNGSFIQPFVGQNVRYVNFNLGPKDTCLLKNYSSFKFYYLE